MRWARTPRRVLLAGPGADQREAALQPQLLMLLLLRLHRTDRFRHA